MAKTTAGSFFHTALDEEVDTVEKQIVSTGGTKTLGDAIQEKKSWLDLFIRIIVSLVLQVKSEALLNFPVPYRLISLRQADEQSIECCVI